MQAKQTTMQGKFCLFLFILFYLTTTVPAGEAPDLFKNQLHFGYGINYKYNGKLYHNLDRVRVVHTVVIPKTEDLIKLPDFPENIKCTDAAKNIPWKIPITERHVLEQTMCLTAVPQLKVLRRQASYLKKRVTTIVKDDLYHALHSLHPVSHFKYNRIQKRALTPNPGSLFDNETLTNSTLTSDIPLDDIPRNRSERAIGLAAIASAALPAIGKLATLAVEELGAYLQRKRNKALKVALQELDREKKQMRNEMHLLEKDFLLYGEFDVNSTMSIIELLDSLDNRTSYLERILQMKVKAWNEKFLLKANGPAMYGHILQLYTDNLREKYIRLYEALETELRLLFSFYCEELFLVKHKTKLSCESAIFYNLTRDVILENCNFKYYYNTTVLPSILDGGSHILLANMLNPKRLICTYDQGLAKLLPTTSYELVSRDFLCYCHLQIGLTYILKSIASCEKTTAPTLEYTVNLAFMDYFHSFWNNGTLSHIPLTPTYQETTLPIAMEDYREDPKFLFYGKNVKRNPQTLKELSQTVYQKQVFLNTRKELFSKPRAELGPIQPETPLSKRSKSSFLFSAIFHIYIFVGSSIGIMWLIPCILFAINQRKMKTLVSAMALHQTKPIEAVAASTSVPAEQIEAQTTASIPSLLEKLTAMDIPTNHMTKLVCHDPWVSFVVTVITIIGVVVYVYRSCRSMSFLKGHKFASICHVHIIFCNNTRYVPLKIGHYIASSFLFQYNELPLVENITLHKHCLWEILHVEWDEERIHYKDRSIPLREHLNVPLKDKIRLRWILKRNYQVMYMVKQGDTWYNLTKL